MMNKTAFAYTLFWQLKKSLKTVHFNILFFCVSRLIWPLILIGTYYLSYSPVLDLSGPGSRSFTGGTDLFSYLVPGVIVVYLYLEYVSIGFDLSVNRDYGILEPVLISPVNRMLWLFGTASSAFPSAMLSSSGFFLSSALLFGISVPHPLVLALCVLFVTAVSIPWGALVCGIFLCGRNSRFLYTAFEAPAEFLSGSRFPIAALPSILSAAALFYPLSHAVTILRLCMLEEINGVRLFSEILWAAGLCILYACIAGALFLYAERKGKRDGTLSFS